MSADLPKQRPPRGNLGRLTKTLRVGLLLAMSFVAALGSAEVLLRVTGLVPTRGGLFTVSAADFDRIPGIFEPGQDKGVREHPELPYSVRIDSLGYRGEEVARSPAQDEVRILFVGDSFVFGSFVDDAETLPAQLAALLDTRCSAPVVVINAGLGGSTIRDQARLVERGLALEPDLVVLQFSENDVRDLVGPAMWEELATNREAKSRFPLGLVYPIVRNSALWSLALRARANLQSRRIDTTLAEGDSSSAGAETAVPTPQDRTPPPMPTARLEYVRHLEGLRDVLAAEEIPLVLTVFPAHLTIYGHWEWDQLDWLDGVVAELGLRAVSFRAPLVADGRAETELFLLPHDGHASPEGYAVAARHLAEALAGTLPGGRCR